MIGSHPFPLSRSSNPCTEEGGAFHEIRKQPTKMLMFCIGLLITVSLFPSIVGSSSSTIYISSSEAHTVFSHTFLSFMRQMVQVVQVLMHEKNHLMFAGGPGSNTNTITSDKLVIQSIRYTLFYIQYMIQKY